MIKDIINKEQIKSLIETDLEYAIKDCEKRMEDYELQDIEIWEMLRDKLNSMIDEQNLMEGK